MSDVPVIDALPIDAKRFALMLDKGAKQRPKTAFAETAIPEQPEADPFDVDRRFAIVWCFYAKGQPHKYTGRLSDIEVYIQRNGRPCLISVSQKKRSRYKSGKGFWRFCNAPGLGVQVLPRWPEPNVKVRRVSNNDRFLVTYSEDGKVVKSKRYRKMPQAFPRDFLGVVGAA